MAAAVHDGPAARDAWRFLGALACLVIALATSGGHAQEDARVSVVLRWDVEGTGCPSAEAVQRAVERLLARPVFVTDGGRGDVEVDARLERDGGELVLLLALRDATGEIGTRAVRGTGSCAQITEAAPLVLALLVDLRRSEVVLHVEPEPAPPEVIPTPAAPPPEPPVARVATWGVELAVGVSGELALLPTPTVSARARATLRPPGWPALALRGAVVFPSTTEGERRARFAAALIGLTACPDLVGDATVRLAACGGVELGALEATGVDLDVVRTQTVPLAQLVAGLELRASPWPALTLGAALEGGVPLVQHAFTFTQRSTETLLVTLEPVWVRLELFVGVAAEL
jgi:hypothetical protein